MSAITVINVGKAYKQYPTRWARLLEWVLPGNRPRHALHWVLQDINFTVAPGEAVGIVGINGAGKSTLLKMITGTTQPTTGSVQIAGRVAALLELGMGFHPDFTGRQNALMAGQLLGYSVEEIEAFMPEIEAFAEIGNYLDQPVRVYSSGMQMRLAFSVATARRPDVLIVDEALSVGDSYFQHKSFDRIRQFSKAGTTLLIVSHDKGAIQTICDRAILLSAGSIAMEGEPEAVMDYYNALLADKQGQNVRQEHQGDGRKQTVSGGGEAVVEEVSLLNDKGERLEIVQVGQSVSLHIAVRVLCDLPELVLGYMIKDRLGQPVYGVNTYHLKEKIENVKQGERLEYRFVFTAALGEGTYSVATALHTGETHVAKNYEWRDFALVFNVLNTQQERFIGVAWLPPRLERIQ